MADIRKSRFSEDQITGFLKQAEAGMPVKELCLKGGFSDATFYKGRARFGGMDVRVTCSAIRCEQLNTYGST